MGNLLEAALLFSNFVLVPALTYGSQLALGALGVTLLFGVLRFSNFAHGDTMAFGTMITILTTWVLNDMGVSISPLPTALLALPVGIGMSVIYVLATDRVVYKFFRDQHAKPVILMMVSLGVMFFTNGLTRLILGADDRQFFDGERFIFTVRDVREVLGTAEGVALRSTQAITIVITIIALVALAAFLQRTRMGTGMRAFSDNRTLAVLTGVSTRHVVIVTWIIVAALATTAGVLYGLDKSYKPFTYFQMLLPIFAAAVVGGIGNPVGAVIGGYLVAFSEIALTYPFRRVFGYLSSGVEDSSHLYQLVSTEYKFSISFVILVFVLLFRPNGILRGARL